MPTFSTILSQSFVEASSQLDAACAWIKQLGINYSPTRVGKYKSIFTALASHQLAGSLEQLAHKLPEAEFVNAAHESAEVVRIYQGLAGVNDPLLVARLRDALRGHNLYVLDKENRSGRDFSFELVIAAKFAKAGAFVDFGHLADLRSNHQGHQLFVECKRLKSIQKVKERIKGGLRQLHARYESTDDPENARGLLVVAAGKLYNAELGYIEATDVQDLTRKTAAFTTSFIEKYRNLWQERPDPRTIGVLVVFDAPAILKPRNLLVTCHEVGISHCMPMDSPRFPYYLSLGQLFDANRLLQS